MKSIIGKLSVAAAILFTLSCGNSEGNMQTMNQMKDSIFAVYPSIAAVTINVQNDNNLVIAVGSQDLYAADDASRQKVADEMTAMATRLFGKDCKLKHGKMLVTKNELNQEAEPADALVSPMTFSK